MRVEPVTLAIVRSALMSAAEEMKINLIRTSHSPLMHEIIDFAVGLFGPRGETLAQASGMPLFLGNLGAAIEDALATYGEGGFEPGDVIITNDPYTTGTHLGDASFSSPIIIHGEVMGFSATRAHLADIGGKAPGGGWYFDTTDVYQEGIRLKSLKIIEAGEANDDVYALVRYNSRFPELVIGDINAQVAACRTGERRFREIVEGLGRQTTRAYFGALWDHGERLSRAAVRAIPAGEYWASAALDNDGVDLTRPVPVEVGIRVDEEEMTIDLSRMPPTAKGPINSGRAAAISAARLAFVSLTAPFSHINEGSFRPLEVRILPGTIVSAEEPAPVAAYGLPLMVAVDLMYRALSPALPGRVAAGHYGAASSIVVYGAQEDSGKRFLHIEGTQGGWGARCTEDGESVVTSLVNGDTRNIPVEVLESRAPLRVERYTLRPDSGGPGRFRGGLGYERVHRILQDGVAVNIFCERAENPAWGLFGGRVAAANSCDVQSEAESDPVVVLKAVGRPLRRGDRLRMLTGGGGGYGSPLERDPERVRRDVVSGYVSTEGAYRDYGVVIDPRTLEVDTEQTTAVRAAALSGQPR